MGRRSAGPPSILWMEEYDHGPIILQESVPVLAEDDPDSLAARVQEKEREIYPKAIQYFAQGRIALEGRRVHLKNPE